MNLRWEYREANAPPRDGSTLHIVAYNIERGRNLDAILRLWPERRTSLADLVVLSEADHGMARSGNRHVAREFGEALGFSWAFAAEFNELTKGMRAERGSAGDNAAALHGNAILSRFPLRDIEVVKLPAFLDYRRRYMARTGSRLALIADLSTSAGDMTVASTHLEPVSTPVERAAQFAVICDALQRRDRGQPIVVAGDMNTICLDGSELLRALLARPWLPWVCRSEHVLRRREPLFEVARERGYRWRKFNQPDHTISDRGYRARLDWFFVRNAAPPAVAHRGIYREFAPRSRYSDHLPVGLELAVSRVAGGAGSV